MSDITKGVLIYNEWFEAMRALDPDNFKKIVLAVYDFQIHDTPPPEFDGVALAIASIIFPYIERRKQKAKNGRLGAAARYSKEYGQPSCDDASANGSANAVTDSAPIRTPIALCTVAKPPSPIAPQPTIIHITPETLPAGFLLNSFGSGLKFGLA